MSKLKINNLRQELNNTKLQVTALALLLDVNESTVSKWNSNIEEPSLKRLDEIGEILETDNRNLLIAKPREKAGLANALQAEYKRLLKSGLPKKVNAKNQEGNTIKINNPEFVKALRNFVAEYKKSNK